ncbi:MAG: HAD family hydrolase [Marinilabiliaceae bacterium]
MQKQYRLVLFDFDKTLYQGHYFAVRLLMANLPYIMRVRAERDARRELAGRDMETGDRLRSELCARMARLMGCDAETAERWYEGRYLPSMCRVLAGYGPRPMAAEVIVELLDAGVKVGVLSDYPRTRERLAAIGLRDARIMCWSSEEAGALKPAGRPFVEAARAAGVAAGETLVVGDRADNDGCGARAAGMDCLLIKGKRATGRDGFEALPWGDVVRRLRALACEARRAR